MGYEQKNEQKNEPKNEKLNAYLIVNNYDRIIDILDKSIQKKRPKDLC